MAKIEFKGNTLLVSVGINFDAKGTYEVSDADASYLVETFGDIFSLEKPKVIKEETEKAKENPKPSKSK